MEYKLAQDVSHIFFVNDNGVVLRNNETCTPHLYTFCYISSHLNHTMHGRFFSSEVCLFFGCVTRSTHLLLFFRATGQSSSLPNQNRMIITWNFECKTVKIYFSALLMINRHPPNLLFYGCDFSCLIT